MVSGMRGRFGLPVVLRACRFLTLGCMLCVCGCCSLACRDICSLPAPPNAAHSSVVGAVRSFVPTIGGELELFVACTVAGTLPIAVQQQIHDAGVHVEESSSSKQCTAYVVTRMLGVVLSLPTESEGSPCSKPSLLLLSNDRDLWPAVALLRRSAHFEQVILVHSGGYSGDGLTTAIPLTQLLQGCPTAAAASPGRLIDWEEEEEDCWRSMHRSSTGCSIPGGITPPSSAASTPSSLASYRSLCTPPPKAAFPHSGLSPSRTSECLQAFTAIVQCCEREKIIPRESVLRKKLLDGYFAPRVDFEDLVACVVGNGLGVVEGSSPQRVVWPRDGQTTRRFAW